MIENNNLQKVDKEATRLRAWYNVSQEGIKSHELAAEALIDEHLNSKNREVGHVTLEALKSHEEGVRGLGEIAAQREAQSKTHYEQNQAAYHELAVHDAESNGTKINISQPSDSPEHVEVKITG